MNTHEKQFVTSRAEALKIGALVDLSPLARLTGLRAPLGITRRAFNAAARPANRVNDSSMGIVAALKLEVFSKADCPMDKPIVFEVPGASGVAVTLLCYVGPGDEGENVLTLALPDCPVLVVPDEPEVQS